MLPAEKLRPALFAMHRLLVTARFEVGNGMEGNKLYEILDNAELLPALILEEPADNSPMFQSVLEGMGEQFPGFAGIAKDFEKNVCWPETVAR